MPGADDQVAAGLSQLSNVLLGEQSLDQLIDTVVGLARSTVQEADG